MFSFQVHHPTTNTAIIADDGTRLTYGDLSDFSGSVNKVIPNRCLVFLLCRNTPGALCGYFSFLTGRIVPLMLDSTINGALLAGLIKTYKPQYLWLPDHRADEFLPAKTVFSGYRYSLVKLETNEGFPLHDDLAMLLATSGSTGSPKFVRISYENIVANAESIAGYLAIGENERPVTTLPMSYSYGLSVINSHILMGATILLTSKTLLEKDFWRFAEEQQASSVSGVPYMYKILKRINFKLMSLPSLTTLTQAGGRLSSELVHEFATCCADSGKKFFVMYGQTEATARMAYLPARYALLKPESIGNAIPGGCFSLVDEHGTEIEEHDTMGELVYKGRNVSMGYANGYDDLMKGDENHGVLFTGDLAKRDSDHFYYIVGRNQRFIKIFGNRVSLDETEILLEKIVPECACTGQDDHLVIYITDMNRMAEVKKYISAVTEIHPTAVSVRHCVEIPRNEAGKTHFFLPDIT